MVLVQFRYFWIYMKMIRALFSSGLNRNLEPKCKPSMDNLLWMPFKKRLKNVQHLSNKRGGPRSLFSTFSNPTPFCLQHLQRSCLQNINRCKNVGFLKCNREVVRKWAIKSYKTHDIDLRINLNINAINKYEILWVVLNAWRVNFIYT